MLTATYVTGAYGRKYKTLEDARNDWKAGKDFKIWDGPYCSATDFIALDSVYLLDVSGKNLGKLN